MRYKNFLVILLSWTVSAPAFCGTDTTSLSTSGPKELHILTYNIKFLPAILLGQHHHPIRRAKFIAEALCRDTIDVIIFQEAFDPTARRILMHWLRLGYPYIIGPANGRQPSFKVCSGVFMASRYPIRMLGEVKFDNCIGYDCMARKGGLLSEVTLPDGRKIQILGTHIQAGAENGLVITQFNQLRGLMDKYKQPGMMQLACGDFNTCFQEHPLYDTLLAILHVQDGPISGEQQSSSDHQHNDMEHYSTEQNLVDYVLFRPKEMAPAVVERRIIKYRHPWGRKHQDLSDHYGVKVTFRY